MQHQGYDVLLVGRRMKSSLPMEPRPYATKRMKLLAEKGPAFYALFNFRLFWFLLFRKAAVLVANDLDTLLPNVLVSKLKGRKLVYDSHEFFTEVPELIGRPKVQRIWKRIERFCIPKVKMAITVNNSIRDKYESLYRIPFKVVRNVSPKFVPAVIKSKEELGLPEKPVLIMQGAGLNIDRGVDLMIKAMPFVQNAVLAIVGDGDIIPEMKVLVKQQGLEEKVLFFGKRPYAELMQYTANATLGLSFDQPTNPNYLYSLPNKVFDYIHTSTPVLCSDVVEVRKIVEQYQLGEVVYNFHPEELAAQIEDALRNQEQLELWRANCKKASELEHWDKEVQQLEEYYPKV
jgi:glycosyltransferase involved in cell wall biosynthesis